MPRPHRIAVTAFPSTQSGTTVKSKVLVFVMSAGAVTPASTPTHAAHTAAMHTTVQCGVSDTGRPIFRRRIVASGPPWVCVGRPEPWMGKFRFVASFRAGGRARLKGKGQSKISCFSPQP